MGLINACDAGREGELIFRRDRSSTPAWTGQAPPAPVAPVHDGRPPSGEAFQQAPPRQISSTPSADAAHLRATGDWLVGMNATRALTQRLKSRGERSAPGRRVGCRRRR